ncbi:isochorismatase domain-containing protein 2 isoform X2 [Mirounga leonina]|uniref:isochorismatase domain-containing protein 2 isoform X2 n=1 Tax=Mirounga leonina TaxID=9715 RepID=UPI00156C3B9F|nr:isochorismatase domain-containing protein 2 isoform X2 [Mirounga leonina]
MAAVKPSLGRVLPGSSILFLCDMQEKFRHIAYFPQIVSVAARMLKAQALSPPLAQVARLLGVPAVLTEQYPAGLGPTVPELGAEGLRPVAKTCFSMVPAVLQELDSRPELRSVLLCGIETQACILDPVVTRGHSCLIGASLIPSQLPSPSPQTRVPVCAPRTPPWTSWTVGCRSMWWWTPALLAARWTGWWRWPGCGRVAPSSLPVKG